MDVKAVLERIDLKSLAEEAGAHFSASNSSRCPLHSGSDNPQAFHVFLGEDRIWHWHCFTRCPEDANTGDAIAFYMRWRGVDFVTALRDLAERAGVSGTAAAPRKSSGPRKPPAPPSPIEAQRSPASPVWQARAGEFIAYAEKTLWSSRGQRALAYLIERRGYTADTIKSWRLGYNPADVRDDPAKWGLSDDKKQQVWRGIVFPSMHSGAVCSINIRRPRPGDDLAQYIGAVTFLPETKFLEITGGRRGLFGVDHLQGRPILILAEGEPDAILAWQAIGDLADVATTGGARHHLDVSDAMLLTRSWVILAILDADDAGDKGLAYLRKVSPRVIAVPPPAHDLTDYWRAGGDLRGWLAGQVFDQAGAAINAAPDGPVAATWSSLMEDALAILSGSRPAPSVEPVAVPAEVPLPSWAGKVPLELADLPDLIRKHHIQAARVIDTPDGLALAYESEE